VSDAANVVESAQGARLHPDVEKTVYFSHAPEQRPPLPLAEAQLASEEFRECRGQLAIVHARALQVRVALELVASFMKSSD